MLSDPSLGRVYLMVDALDECGPGQSLLLDFIANSSSTHSQVKWLVSSRNKLHIEERLSGAADSQAKISLESNSDPISSAVDTFIKFKVSKLTEQKKYKDEIRKKIQSHLHANANGTFLWVSLVCKALEDERVGNALSLVVRFPPGLEPLYGRMMEEILNPEDGNYKEVCKQILASLTLAIRPIHLKELGCIADLQEWHNNLQGLNKLVALCGSFLTVQEETVHFIHQSAKDYFTAGKGSSSIFPLNQADQHCKIMSQSLQTMSDTLRKDICDLRFPCTSWDELSINRDPLAHIQYACSYWVDHRFDANNLSQDMTGFCEHGKVH